MYTALGANASDPGILDRFYAKVDEFRAAYANLLDARSIAMAHPDLWAEYQSLVTRGGNVTSAIDTVISKAQGAWDFVSSAPGAAYDWIKSAVGLQGQPEGLGFIPLVVGAAALGVLAMIVSWLSDAAVFTRKLQAVASLTAKGMPTEEAVRAVQGISQPAGGSVTGNMSQIAMWLALGAFAIFVVPKLLDNRK